MARVLRRRALARTSLALGAMAWTIFGSIAPAGAGVGSDMEQAFSDMGVAANATGPVAYQGQSAGYYSLGSMWARFPQKTVYPANLQLPKVTAGCGGIDMFTGSFSFINSDQFVAMAKAVANNAIGFAFHLAIQAISPQIDKVMGDLEKAVQDLNQFNINSCEAASALVGGVAGEMGIKSNSVCNAVGTSKGIFSDWARSRQGCGNGGQQTSTLNQADGALKQQLPGPKNYAWAIIKASPMADQSQQMRELMMTLTGTIVVPARGSDSEEPTVQYVGPQVGPVLDALLDGNQSVNILKCTDGTDCLSLQTGGQTVAALGTQALRPHVKALIQSMSDKIATDTVLTAEERNLLGTASVPLYKILAVQAASGFRLSDAEIDSLAEVVSIDMLDSIVTHFLDQVAASRGGLEAQSNASNVEQYMAQLRDVRGQIAQRAKGVTDRVNRTFDIVDRAMRIESTLQSRMAPGLAASLNFSRALSAQGLRP